ncbi:putative elongator complex protein 1 [Gracilariopsis chorda]|uniref:Elongator complex protein 1 n=1 Tax=Gracilariopsis chorda TaxID=448386 RepID=A0A2V3J5V0_9FLOR|nr:putative elongator complex protein 1 [Gracilariopsis chorda]|eukprot:PXF49785.1 putative elongator complex protein 1 [Gracilariopsis chorda]
MQNLLTLHQHASSLPPNATHAAFYEELQTIHRSSGTLLLHSASRRYAIDTTSDPVGLTIHNGFPMLATRRGELISIVEDEVSFVGDVTHDSPEKSGILAICASSDGCLLAVVSPISITVLDSDFESIAEISLDKTATEASIAWRSDGEFFTVVYKSDRVYGLVINRSCEEIKPIDVGELNLRCTVAWEPRAGGMISIPGEDRGLFFFERNGLRHFRSDFEAGAIRFARWSHNARILATVDEDGVTFWNRVNYYWYQKKTLSLKDRIAEIVWDEDDVFCAHIITSTSVIDIYMNLHVCSVIEDHRMLYTAVIDGSKLAMTNLSRGIVPPPMSHGNVELSAPIDSVFDAQGAVGALRNDGILEIVRFSSPLTATCVPSAPAVESIAKQQWKLPEWELENLGILALRLPVLIETDVLAVVKSVQNAEKGQGDRVYVYRLSETRASLLAVYTVPGYVTTMCKSNAASLTLTTTEKSVIQLNVHAADKSCTEHSHRISAVRNEPIAVRDTNAVPNRKLSVVLDSEGELSVIDCGKNAVLSLSCECTSFVLHAGFLLFTSRSHLLYCLWMNTNTVRAFFNQENSIPSIVDELDAISGPEKDSLKCGNLAAGVGAIRPIDRGSLLVAGIPNDVTIVLQAPRGNLETVAPRPLVFEAVHRLSKAGNFAKAFNLCRKQRVDMNHVVDADYDSFIANSSEFVKQIGNAEHLSVFMSFLSGDKHKRNSVCDSIVAAMKKHENVGRFTTAILTGLVRREPPNLSGALETVRDARARSNQEGVGAVDYLFVLMKDEEMVYNHALGMYDLNLAAFIAESSQMDPAEFAKELQGLHSLPESYRKYTIDMKLERYDNALRHLYACGRKRFGDCVALSHEHDLYETAIPLFREEQDIIPDLVNGYGQYLQKTDRFDDAAAVFIQNGDFQNASICYRKGGRWQMSVGAISRLRIPTGEKLQMYEVVSTELAEAGKLVDAAKVRALLLKDIEGALELLVISEDWEAAFEFGAIWSAESLEQELDLERRIAEGVREGFENLSSTIRENCSKLHERRVRLETVRRSKEAIQARLGAGRQEDEAGSDVFSATTASSIASHLSDVTFTSKTSATSLYTSINQTGPLTNAKLEKQAERRRRKAAKKRIREGHPREEEALVAYLKKLIPNDFLRTRVTRTSRALLDIGKSPEVRILMTEVKKYIQESLLLPEDVLPIEERSFLEDHHWMVYGNLLEVLHPKLNTQ